MDFKNIDDLKNEGFIGFKSVKDLWKDKSCIPKIKGVYLVLDQTGDPDFTNPGVGGFFKGRNPNVSLTELNDNYVPNSLVVYIGKAGEPAGEVTLYSRLSQYLSFGRSKKVSHWGGRLIWQLKYHMDLILCWKPTPDDDPREVEKSLIQAFVIEFERRPFANLND